MVFNAFGVKLYTKFDTLSRLFSVKSSLYSFISNMDKIENSIIYHENLMFCFIYQTSQTLFM